MEPDANQRAWMLRTLLVWAAAFTLTVVMTWPLASGLGSLSRVRASGDARFSIWNVAWVAHALVTAPDRLFDANIFHPHRTTLAYSEANIGAGVLAVPVWWLTRNPYTAHNAVVLFAFAASAVFTWRLVRRLTSDPVAAAMSAAVFAFTPFIFSHTAHIQLLMSAGLPLAMLLVHGLVDHPSPRRGLALGLTVGAQALSCAYYGIFAGLMVGYASVFYACSRRQWTSWRYWGAIATAAGVSVAVVLPFFLPYVQIQQETGFARLLDDARAYSASWRSYLASAANAHRWMLPALQELGGWNGEVLFPGFLGSVLAVAGLATGLSVRTAGGGSVANAPRETVLLYGSLGVLAFWASLGPNAGLYTLLYHAIPVFSLLRAPGRTGILVVLAVAVLAGMGLSLLRARVSARPGLKSAIGAGACILALVELNQVPFDWRPALEPSPGYQVLARLPRGPVAEFPFFDRRIDFHIHTRYMLFSTTHWQPLLNGYSDFIPADFRTLASKLATFPSQDSFRAMKERRVRYITIHREAYGTVAATDVERRLEPFRPHLKLLADDPRMLLFEIVSWPY
jgi:hypothetical protein